MSNFEKRNQESSVKLCTAVKKYKCLHDQNSYHKNASAECEDAWQLVAFECDETVEHCKSRWKTLRRCFFQGLKRRGNRYYLHEHLAFLQGHGKKAKKRKQESLLNVGTNSNTSDTLQKHYDDGISLQGSEIETINIYDDEDARSISSQTTSADESHEMDQSNQMGVFIIDEIEENGDEATRTFMDVYNNSINRSFDPKQVNELAEEEPEKKRSRRTPTEKKMPTNDSDKHNKQLNVRVDKLKINLTQNRVETLKNKTMDRFTNTDPQKSRDFATQYEINSMDFDDIFMQLIKTQLDCMNGRQKMNFKRKTYQSLLEVFDDASDFPKHNETLQVAHKQVPPTLTATVGEMRLMRELVSLVQAAKNTPEIMNAKQSSKMSTPVQNKSPLKMPLPIVENSSKARKSPLSLSPTTDDDDFQLLIDNIDNDDTFLAHPLGDGKAKPAEPTKTVSESTARSLPQCVLQKLVKVGGPSGGTIVTRDGDKRRVYRIFPKKVTPIDNRTFSTTTIDSAGNILASSSKSLRDNKNGNSSGTFYVSSIKHPEDINKNNNTLSGITIRSFNNRPTNNTNEPLKLVNQSNQPASYSTTNNTTNGPTIYKAIHPANRVLSPTTGIFKMVPTTKTVSPTYIQKPATLSTAATTGSAHTKVITTKLPIGPMLPPTSNIITKRTTDVRIGPQLVRRRYSICGPLPAEKSLNNTANPTNNCSPQEKSSISQIKISQPISLNSKALNTPTPPDPLHMSSNNNTKSTAASPAPQEGKLVQIKPVKPFQESVSDKQSLASAKEPDVSNRLIKNKEIPILQTAGTVEADILDPLFIKPPQIKSEPVTE